MNDEFTVRPAGVGKAVRVATAVWATASGTQFVVWLLITIIGGHLVAPWWLWTVGAGGVLVGGWWLAASRDESARGEGR